MANTLAIISVITHTCAFPALTSQNICCAKGLLPALVSQIESVAVSEIIQSQSAFPIEYTLEQ